jgi:hypothetical protein
VPIGSALFSFSEVTVSEQLSMYELGGAYDVRHRKFKRARGGRGRGGKPRTYQFSPDMSYDKVLSLLESAPFLDGFLAGIESSLDAGTLRWMHIQALLESGTWAASPTLVTGLAAYFASTPIDAVSICQAFDKSGILTRTAVREDDGPIYTYTATFCLEVLGQFEVTGAGYGRNSAKARAYQNLLLAVCGAPIDFAIVMTEELASQTSLRELCSQRGWPAPGFQMIELTNNKIKTYQAIATLDVEGCWEAIGEARPWMVDAKTSAISKLYAQVINDLQPPTRPTS